MNTKDLRKIKEDIMNVSITRTSDKEFMRELAIIFNVIGDIMTATRIPYNSLIDLRQANGVKKLYSNRKKFRKMKELKDKRFQRRRK